jgi:DNA-binding transcriptional LysR family regulator
VEHRQLRIFGAVARALSFTRAAKELGYVQSNVTAQVKALEAELGLPLFDRLGRRVVLTDAGRALQGYAGRILDLHEEARAAVALAGGGRDGEPTGSLTISAPETLCTYRLPRLLRRFGERYPGVRLAFRPVPCSDLKAGVAEGTLDAAFLLEEPVGSTALEIETLLEEPLLLLAPPEHPLAFAEGVGPADLDGERVLLTESGCSYRRIFERRLAEAGVGAARALEFDSVEAIKQCVIAGMGVAVLPAVAVGAELERGEIASLPWSGPELTVPTRVAWHKDKWVSPALQAFLSLSREMLREGQARTGG